MAGTSASAISLLKPIGSTTSSSPSAIRPAIDTSSWLSPGPACGKESKAHSTMVEIRMIVPARRRKITARCHSPIATSRRLGI
jgi:hypothetical protein